MCFPGVLLSATPGAHEPLVQLALRWTAEARAATMARMGSGDEDALQQRWLATVQRIVAEHLRGTAADVYLFGSRARGDERVWSDIDIAVDVHGPLADDALVKLRGALEESSVPLFVDVVDLRRASPAIRERVLSEGKRWTVSHSA